MVAKMNTQMSSTAAVHTKPESLLEGHDIVQRQDPALNSRHLQISVVVPALNEAENLPHVLPRIPRWVHEVILVDGHSTDRTVEVARELMPDIRVVQQEGRGKGAALRSGFAAVTGDIVVMLDADGSTDPAEIPSYVGALLGGADFVKGSRFLQGGGTADMPIHRRAGNAFFVHLVRQCFGGHYSDLCYGYNAMWSWTLPLLDLDGDGFEIETMMNIRALRLGLNVAEVPSFEAPRIYGVGRLQTFPDGWRVLKTIFREWRSPSMNRTTVTQLQQDRGGDRQMGVARALGLEHTTAPTLTMLPSPESGVVAEGRA